MGRSSATALAIAAALAAAAAVGAASAQPQQGPAWQMDWGEEYCTLFRLPDEGAPFVAGLRSIPGTMKASLFVLAEGRDTLPRGVSAVALAPSGAAFDVSADVEIREGGLRALLLHDLPDEFIDAFAAADEVRLKTGARTERRVPLTEAQAAVAELRRCLSETMREWGIDEAALRSLRHRPSTTNALGLSNDDYPAEALASGSEGRVVVRIAVSSEGRAAGCAPLVSSGSEPLDRASCAAILRGARFSIPLDAEGRPTSAQIVSTVRWTME